MLGMTVTAGCRLLSRGELRDSAERERKHLQRHIVAQILRTLSIVFTVVVSWEIQTGAADMGVPRLYRGAISSVHYYLPKQASR